MAKKPTSTPKQVTELPPTKSAKLTVAEREAKLKSRLDALEARIVGLETQLTSANEYIRVLESRQQRNTLQVLETLGGSLVHQARDGLTRLTFPTTIKRVPEDEEAGEGTLTLMLLEGKPMLFKRQSPDGTLTAVAPTGVDMQVLEGFVAREALAPGESRQINLYVTH